MENKVCNGCREVKPISEFHRRNNRPSGVQNKCKKCKAEQRKSHYSKNKETENKQHSEWSRNNVEVCRYQSNKRRAALLNRTPRWLDDADLFYMKEAYWWSKERERLTQVKHHVDHIIPLQGKNVCGLHVPDNLRVVPYFVNLSKSNKYK